MQRQIRPVRYQSPLSVVVHKEPLVLLPHREQEILVGGSAEEAPCSGEQFFPGSSTDRQGLLFRHCGGRRPVRQAEPGEDLLKREVGQFIPPLQFAQVFVPLLPFRFGAVSLPGFLQHRDGRAHVLLVVVGPCLIEAGLQVLRILAQDPFAPGDAAVVLPGEMVDLRDAGHAGKVVRRRFQTGFVVH